MTRSVDGRMGHAASTSGKELSHALGDRSIITRGSGRGAMASAKNRAFTIMAGYAL